MVIMLHFDDCRYPEDASGNYYTRNISLIFSISHTKIYLINKITEQLKL